MLGNKHCKIPQFYKDVCNSGHSEAVLFRCMLN